MGHIYKTHFIEKGFAAIHTTCGRPIKEATKVTSRVSEMNCDDCLKMLYVYPKK